MRPADHAVLMHQAHELRLHRIELQEAVGTDVGKGECMRADQVACEQHSGDSAEQEREQRIESESTDRHAAIFVIHEHLDRRGSGGAIKCRPDNTDG